MDKVNWGIIGAGDVTEKKSGPALYKTEHSALVAIMRRDAAKAKDYALRHNAVRYYTDADKLIADPDVNMIYVATPPDSHKEYAIKALQSGKPVYVEKPMAMNYAECLEMTDAAEKSGQKLFVAYYRRVLPYFCKVKELLDSKAIGNILTVEVRYFRPPSPTDLHKETHTWRVKREIAGEGYFFDLAPHTLDILDFLLGEIVEAQGFAENMAELYDVADTVSCTFRFRSGVSGTGQWCFVAAEDMREDIIRIVGTKGTLAFNTFAFEPIRLKVKSGEQQFTTPHPEHIQQPLIQTIVDELRGVGECPSTGMSAARTSRVMDWIINRS